VQGVPAEVGGHGGHGEDGDLSSGQPSKDPVGGVDIGWDPRSHRHLEVRCCPVRTVGGTIRERRQMVARRHIGS
jgi:hypothetical protein